jgi:uncharacterized protein with PIN domain
MDLEEHTLEVTGNRCEECGTELTEIEQEAVLESGGPVLCAIHAAELAELDDDEDDLLDA